MEKKVKAFFGILLLSLSVSFVGCHKKEFNSEEWKDSYDANRGFGAPELKSMAEDLVASRKLIGLTHKQMLDLLGPPENDPSSTWYTLEENYDTIDPVSGNFLQIDFNKDSIITKAYVREWHKH